MRCGSAETRTKPTRSGFFGRPAEQNFVILSSAIRPAPWYEASACSQLKSSGKCPEVRAHIEKNGIKPNEAQSAGE